MTDPQIQPSKGTFKGTFKKRFKNVFSGSHSGSAYPQPFLVQSDTVSSGRQSIDPVNGVLPGPRQRDYQTSAQLSESQPSSSSSGPTGSAGQHNFLTQDGTTLSRSINPHGNLLLERLEPSHAADHKYEPEGEERQLLRRAVCTPGTRVRILSDITKWANDTSSGSQSVYWLFGQAGSGKSTIAYTIARRFDFANDPYNKIVLGGNFFCSRQMKETRSATRIIRTIVYHLALRCKAFADALHAFGKFDTIRQSAHAQLESLLIEPWKQAQSADPSKPPRFLVVIDALDEIDGQGGSEFLRDLLDGINKYQLRGLKFFATSRLDPDLVTHLQSFEDKRFYRLEQVPLEEAEADITAYLNTNLPYFAGSQEMMKLVGQAAGLFIYAATIVKYLANCSPREQRGRIGRLPDSGIPQIAKETPLLDSLYLQVLRDAFDSVRDEPVDFKQRLNIMHTFLCSAEPISISLVAELLFPSDEDEPDPAFSHTEIANRVLASLHAVLYTENDKVLSYHKSFTDLMFNQNRAAEFWCDPAQHHLLLAGSCLRMLDGLKFNIANIESSFLLDRDNSALPYAVKQNIPPVLSYSCRNWDYHVSAVALTDSHELRAALSRFLQLRVLFWIEAMNLLGSRSLCEKMLRRARNWITKDDLALGEDFAEAASFALYFSGSEAALSTPHLYISVLATWPCDFELIRGWRSHFPGIPGFTRGLQRGRQLMSLEMESPVYAVAFSSDDRRIISGSGDKLVQAWDASTGEMLKLMEGHTGGVWSVAFSNDDKHIISGSGDNSVRLWDSSTGEMMKVLEGHTNGVWSVAFSSDDKCIVSGSWDKSVRVWDASTGKTLKVLEGHTDGVWSVAFSSMDMYIGSGSDDKSVRVWDTSTGKVIKVLKGHKDGVLSVTFSSDNRHIISGSEDGSVRVWDISTGETLKLLKAHTSGVLSVTLSNKGRTIVSGSRDKSVRVWDASTSEMLTILTGHTADVLSVQFSSNHRYIISGSRDQSLRVWDFSTTDILEKLEGHTDSVLSVAFSSDDKHIISGSQDNSVRVWDALTGVMLKVLAGHTAGVSSVAFSSDNQHIISGSWDHSVRLWDSSTGEMLKVFKLEGHRLGGTDTVTSVAFSSNNRCIVSGSSNGLVWVWDALTGEMLKELDGHRARGAVNSVAFSSKNRRIVSILQDGSVWESDVLTGAVLKVHRKEDHTSTFSPAGAFSSDSLRRIIASSGITEKLLHVWEASTGKTLKVLEGHTDCVTSVAFSRDERHIVSGSQDKSVRVWDTSTGEMLKVLEGHTGVVTSVAFSSNDQHIVSGSSDKSVRIWDASTDDSDMLKVLDGHTDNVQYKSVRAWALSRQQISFQVCYIRQKIVDPFGDQGYSGWLISPQGGHYLMFVPPTINIPDFSNIRTLPRSYSASVDFTSSTLGPEWHNCFSP
ncbi:hypothetical protein GALMADRAFT_125121 [Galerina marginata CBS 339.88]|uniref:Nephrocystin 3-like N-terminal domain-containing protein n=1 Tax=Galerina marginata (strain CBS 339.88) TaxID=685588 RepID=A0A067SQE1_GALM3|nr:hypothetical protein GALMADRAFT_125121 [Galerina marginata CBS 339.88]